MRGSSAPASGVAADSFRAFPGHTMSPVRRLVDGGIHAALQYAVPVARRLRSALSEDHQAEREVTAVRRELDETRAALRLQTARCRQLVAAYSDRLRAGDALRDHQLTLVLRALVALEARLRREQKAIRAQLAQRDAIIHQQQVEISRLRAAQPPSAQPQHPAPSAPQHAQHAPASRSASSSSTVTPSQLIVENHTCGQDSSCDQEQSLHGRTHETVVDAMSHLRHQEAALRVLELVGPPQRPPASTTLPLLNGETACIVEPPADFIEDQGVVTPPPDVVASYNEMNRECLELASMAASLRGVGDKGSCYQDNPVLECVNLILLRDQEDFHEERRGRGQQARARGGRGRRSVEEHQHPDPPAWYNGGPPRPPRPTPPALPPKPPRLVGQRPAPTRNSKSPTPASTPTSTPTTPTTPTSTPTMPDKVSPPPSPPAADEREDGNEALRRNFEEFNLDDCDIDGLGQAEPASPKAVTEAASDCDGDGRPRAEGDGAESGRLNGLPAERAERAEQGLLLTAPAEAPGGVPQALGLSPALAGTLAQQLAQLAPANYDSFLEATGLSNKSILTPSRMLSNHRSVLKPKDVKHRSRVKAGERCALPSGMPGPTVKYWTEPFL
ncbi:hypothetical protein FOCC_FOCC011920 [Frankliniella occidentalis]|uniref:Uncharacterized protein LOC113209070 isoform X2 n=1 Tax=Frankliniella occidentalis TaxID=133901 RepID=A0A9C6X1F5_FRAOC|nr:uncharacterized protein LOC113209070 isoform X2 [Frankliniella occidentalis]KAE8742510.1 hypothetical protein FOCC_FOCC011920 [Frankliniella occidentalis]